MLACPKYRRQKERQRRERRERERQRGGERVKRDAHLGFELSFELRFRVCRIDPALPCLALPCRALSMDRNLYLSSSTLLLPRPPSGKWQLTMRMLRMEMESEIVNRRCLCSFHGAIALRFVHTKIYIGISSTSETFMANFTKVFQILSFISLALQ